MLSVHEPAQMVSVPASNTSLSVCTSTWLAKDTILRAGT